MGRSLSARADEVVYRSHFRRWEQRSSVRTKPRRTLDEGEGSDALLYFPPELVPHARHPMVERLGADAQRVLLIQRLHVYLDFTAELEQRAINPVALELSRRQTAFDLPEAMFQDAYKIVTDEAWHAQFSDDLQRQVVSRTGIRQPHAGPPAFMKRLGAVQRSAPPEMRELIAVFFSIVSETLISAILSDIPRDRRIVPAVRELVGDHAMDERVHHAYFSGLLARIWPQLNRRQQLAIGPLFAEFIRAFLDPDLEAVVAGLREVGLQTDEIGTVIVDSYADATVDATVREAAAVTLRHMQNCGVLDNSEAVEALEAARLLYPPSPVNVSAAADGVAK